MSDKVKIKNKIFNFFSNFGLTVYDEEVLNGYYLLETGENSVVHFKINGCKNWLFGLWLMDSEDKMSISLFGQHKDYIDKFKPTACSISEEIEIPNGIGEDELNEKLEEFVWSSIYNQIEVIHSSNTAAKIKFYYHRGGGNVILWLFKQWWFYHIKTPVNNWLKDSANGYLCAIICVILNNILWWKLYSFYSRTIYLSPSYSIKVNYKEGVSDDFIYCVYRILKPYMGFSKAISVEHIPFGEKRGIYFDGNQNEEDED